MSDKSRFRSIGVEADINALATKEASDIAGQQSLLKDTVGWTGKNRLNIPDQTLTSDGVTVSINNGVASFSGTNASSGALWIAGTGINIPKGTYIFNGLDTTQNIVSNLQLLQSDNTEIVTTNRKDSSKTVTIPNDLSNCKVHFRIVANGNTDGIKAYPMLRDASIADDTYEPYHESVEVMYEEEVHGVNIATAYPNYALFGSTTEGFQILSNKTGGLLYIAPIKHNTSYIASKAQVGNRFRIVLFKNEPSSVSSTDTRQVIFESDTDRTSYEFTNTDYNYVVFATAGEGGGGDVNTTNGMLRKADIEDSTYRPYNHQAIQNQLNAQGVLGAKNLLENEATSQTINGVTFTVNDDGSITANGTATNNDANFYLIRYATDNVYKDGYKILSGCPANGSDTTYKMTYRIGLASGDTYVTHYDDFGNGVTVRPIASNENLAVSLIVRKGQTVTNLIFKPMLRLASDPDDTYQPYAMTNRELTEYNKGFNFLKFLFNADGSDIYSGNLNDLHAGYAYYSSAAVNIPSDNFGYCITLERPSTYNYTVQIAITSTGDSANMYVRKKSSNTWGAWKTVTMS